MIKLITWALIPIGLGTKFYSGPAELWVRHHLGGLLYVSFFALAASLLLPTISKKKVVFGAFALVSLQEFSQLIQFPWLNSIRANFWGHLVLGHQFSPPDFYHYALGALMAYGLLSIRSNDVATRRLALVAPPPRHNETLPPCETT